jgi:hypothetical protein
MPHGAAIVLAAASSFGAGLGMLRLPAIQRRMALQAPAAGVYLNWSIGWGVAAAVVVVIFLFFIGPGLK